MSDRSHLSTGATGTIPRRVALIEDDVDLREVIADILEDEGITVDVCALGWQAHHTIRKSLPHLIILDVQMPAVNGIQLFYLVRGDPKTASIPVIFLTANPMMVGDQLPNYEEMGAVVLPKPFRIQDLLDMVQAALAP